MLKEIRSAFGQKGSMMIEALAMLGLISMVTPMLYKKAAERTTELADINAASAARTLSAAMESYLSSNKVALDSAFGGSNNLELNPETALGSLPPFTDYLPEGFMKPDEGGKIFSGYQIAIHKKEDAEGNKTYTGMVALPTTGEMDSLRRARIASMIGGNGGMVQDGNASGVQGLWEVNTSNYFAEGLDDGTIVAATMTSVGAGGTGGGGADANALYRNDAGGEERRTMESDLIMDSNAIRSVLNLYAAADDIHFRKEADEEAEGGDTSSANIYAGNASISDLMATGTANITRELKAGAEAFIVNSNSMNFKDILSAEESKVDIKTNLNASKNVIIGSESDRPDNFTATTQNINLNAGEKIGISTEKDLDLSAKNNMTLQSSNNMTINSTGGETNLTGETVKVQSSDESASLTLSNTGNMELSANDFSLSNNRLDWTLDGSNSIEISNSGAIFDIPLQATQDVIISSDGEVGGGSTDGNFYAHVKDLTLHAENAFNIGSDDEITIFAGDEGDGTHKAQLTLNKNGTATLSSSNGAKITVSNDEVDATKGNVSIFGDNTYLRADATVATGNFYVSNSQSGGTNDFDHILQVNPSGNPTAESDENASVYIRKGAIEVKSGREIAAGEELDNEFNTDIGEHYIRADRFLTTAAKFDIGQKSNVGTEYTSYMVNPAYTSVMHDIKLTTRGNARLSDILPDFITKGIYVLDNTYRETFDKETSINWRDNVPGGVNPISLENGNIKIVPTPITSGYTSPWLGFVPTPSCPPGYAKIITINPIRWRMSEVFRVTLAAPTEHGTSNAWMNFDNYLEPLHNPIRFGMEVDLSHISVKEDGTLQGQAFLGKRDPATGVMELNNEEAIPPTFQTNTWLNTSVAGANIGGKFYGWHALMGFMYQSNEYLNFIKKAGIEGIIPAGGAVIWNLFPVRANEMMAIAHTYCHFDKGNASWNTNYIDNDQPKIEGNVISNIRTDYEQKNTDYINRLNDPSLKYSDPW